MGSFNDEYQKLRKKRLEEQEETKSSVPYQRQLNTSAPVNSPTYAERVLSGDIAPIKTAPQKEEKERKWFDSGAFDDGYQFGDITKTILGTARDVRENFATGVVGLGEKVVDALVTIAPYIAQGQYYANGGGFNIQADQAFNQAMDVAKKENAELVKKDLYNEEDIAKTIIAGLNPQDKLLGITADDSISGEKLDSLVQSGGEMAVSAALGPYWWLVTGASALGSEAESALNSGASLEEAAFSGMISAGAEIATEKIFGAIKFGGKSLEDILGNKVSKALANNISNKTARTLVKMGYDAAGEGFEEVLSGTLSAMGKQLSYSDEEEIKKFFESGEAWDSFVGGAAMGGVMSGGKAALGGTDITTGLTKNEQAVADAEIKNRIVEREADGTKLTNAQKSEIRKQVYKDLEKGYISTDTIEEVLGGEDYTNYKNELKRQQDIDNELNELRNMKSGDMTDIQIERMAELKGMTPNTEMTNELKFSIDEKIRNALSSERNGKGSYLFESYNEQTRRGQAFEADLSKYDSKQAEIVKRAIDSGILNNTNRTHDFVDMVAKISADKGVLFDFLNNEKLKNSSFAVDGKFVNGYLDKKNSTIGVNIDSAKVLNTVVGHEITHVLEGTELYAALKVSIQEYAKSKGDYQSRLDTLTKLYEGVEGADVSAELTADLVGDYLFTDEDFINHLSTSNRNVFQKIYDEIKYLYKVATAGSKQARELEKVKRAFEKAYRESGNTEGTKYSLSEQKTPTYKDLVGKKPTKIINITEGIESGSYADMKAATMSKAKNEGWFDAPHHNDDTDSQIFLTEKSFTHAYSNLSAELGEDTIRCLAHIPEIIKEAVLVSVDDPRNNQSRETKVYTFFGAVEGVNGIEPVKLTVKEFDFKSLNSVPKNIRAYFENNGIEEKYNSLYDARALEVIGIEGIKKESDASVKGYAQGAQAQDTSDSTISIADLLKLVKGDAEKYIPKFSLSDSDGKKLTKEQSEYFKDSKMRDDNGNLKVMYHGSQDAGFHIFDAKMSDDDTSFFFVDRNDVAASYSGTSETYAPKAFKTVEDANKFFAEINATEYAVIENNGKYTLLEDGDEIATSDDLADIYEEWRDWSGLGYGDANYKVYLNLTNPLEIDAEGRNWNNISREFSQEVADRYHSLTADESAALTNLAEWGEYGIFKDEMLEARANAEQGVGGVFDEAYTKNLARAYEKLGGANANLYDAFSIASDNFSEESIKQFAVKQMNTRDYAQKAKAEGYDGVIFKNIHDNGGYSNGDEGASTVAIAFESNQIKSVANDKPTADKDIRFSLSEAVEETPDLIAIHNLQSSELPKALALGGMPMPSIAVIKAQQSHESYGDVSLIFPKDTIDPQKNRDNKVYGGDAWTPTYPSIEYKASEKAQKAIKSKIDSLVPYEARRGLGGLALDYDNISNDLNRHNGDLYQAYKNNYAMQYAFLVDNGYTNQLPTEQADLDRSGRFNNDFIIDVAEKLGATEVERLVNGRIDDALIANLMDMANENAKKKYAGNNDLLEFLQKRPFYTSENFGFAQADNIIRAAYRYVQNGIEQTVDYKKATDVIRDAVDADKYKQWLDGLFADIVEKEGIRNNADYYTPSGNRRSWEALHWENTLENVLKVMKAQDQTGQGFFGGASIFGVANKNYRSIAEVKADSERLRTMSQDEYDALKESFSNRLVEIATSIKDPYERNGFIAIDNAVEEIVDAVRANKTKSGILRYMQKWNKRVTETTVEDIVSLVTDISNMPTGYFEAKPQRAVGFDEVGVFVIPNNADAKLKQELLNRGYSIAEYDPNVEGDRQKVVNSFEDYKFSLSDTNEAPTKTYGNFNVYGKDVKLDIAPVGVAVNATTTEDNSVDMGDEFAPVVNSYTIEQELDKIGREIEALAEESTELYNNGDEEAAMKLVEKINELSAKDRRLREQAETLKAQEEAERKAYMDSLADVEPPVETERAYSEADRTPLDDKTLKTLTKGVRDVLSCMPKESKAIREVIEKYSTTDQKKSELFRELKEKFGDKYEYHRYSDIAEAKKTLRTYKFNVSDQVKGDIADFRDYKKSHNVRTSKNALSVDVLYEELSGLYPGLFPADITNETDRFERISEVSVMPAAEWVKVAELSDNEIMQAADFIHNSVTEYRNNAARKAAEANARAYIDDVAPSRAKEITEKPLNDTAPRYQDINSRLEQEKATLTKEFEQKKAQMQSELADKNTFISNKAKELYNEIRNLKKGVRASKELGYILDHGYEWKSIKTALINAMNSPGKTVNANSAAEGVVRELLNEVYESSMYDLSDMDNEYQKQVAKLEAKAEKERSGVQIKTVKERLAEKLSNVEKELADNKRLRADSVVDFNREIARLQEEYNSKANKNTKAANDILRRIERLQTMKNNVDADYEKRISDLETRKTKLSEDARTGTSATEQAVMRAELHLSKIDNIRAKFAEKGLDFDKTLKKAKDLSTFTTVDNTPQRVMEKSLGYKAGQILADETVNKVAQNETEGIKWLNSYTDRKNGLLAQISKQYNIKPGSKASAAAQMYAEGFYVNKDNEIIKYGDNELAMDFPNAKVRENIKGLARDTRIRKIYDDTLDMINDSRARNAYPEIQKLDNYFLHFRAMDDTFSQLGLPFNPNDIRAKDLPTDLNGVTANLKPGQPYFASAMHREGLKTSYDLLGGLERYLSSSKNQIYHIDDIQTLRALRNHIADTYGQANGLEGLDALSEAEAQEKIKQVFNAHLSTFAKFLNEEANIIAGKTALIDRGFEGIFGRRAMTFMDTLNKQVGANMVGFNVSSSLTNFIAPVQAFAKTNKVAFVKGFAQTVYNKLGSIAGKTDGFAEKSPVMIRRKGADRFYRTPFQKVGDAGYVLMSAVDDISTEIIARAKYNELTAKGLSADQAHFETDKWVSRLMGDRSLGQMPQLYNSKTLGIITKFQLEVRNQLDSQFYDTIQEAKADNATIDNALARNAKTAAKVTSTFVQLAIAQHLFGKAFESIAGYNPAFDIIEVIMTALGFDDDEESEDTALDNIQQGFLALLEDLPYTSTLTGGRIPISSALPITELIKGEDEYGNEKSRLETLGEIAPYYVLPGGYGQIKKTIQGLGMFSDEHPIAGSYTDSGKLRFPVDETFGNVAQAAIFGQYASQNARDYFDNDIAPLNEKQTQEFIDVDMDIHDYWDYREGLSKYKTLAEKADYINSLDLTDEQKNILINNIADRKEDIDMSDYDNYDSFEEFDYANKYPEKYEFWKQNGISYEDYVSGDDDTKAAYNWAYENPDKFTLSKAVASDVVTYRQYAKDLNDIKADKDSDGKSITGSRKAKVVDYINNLDADYGSKIILFKSEYPADDTYNVEIVNYLNSREDISYKEMETILKELGFNVDSNGRITWD